MKGVNKRVIEIIETENEAIERVLVFLKPNAGNVRVAQQKAEAEKYVSGLVCWRRVPWLSSRPIRLCVLLFAVLGFAGALWMLI